ncbi:MAG: phosphoglycerate kinase [Elusimicrobiota bacterium]
MKKTIKDIQVKNKKVLVRVDFNVPLSEDRQITDDTRIKETLPTINYLLKEGAKVILVSHLGRPKGKPEEKYSLKPVAKRLGELLKKDVLMAADCTGSETKKQAMGMVSGDVLLLENVRFYGGEEKNDPAFAKELSSIAEVFVQDAFGTAHRAHASTVGVAKYLPSCAGLLLEKEIQYFSKLLENPQKNFVAILGGAKVSDKIMVIENLLSKIDALIIGGAMAYTFLRVRNINTGNSLVEQDKIDIAHKVLKKAEEKKLRIFLPIDHRVVEKVSGDSEMSETQGVEIKNGYTGVDIGPMTVARIAPVIMQSKTIFWNGPMGIFEIDKFAGGTIEIAKLVANATDSGAVSIIGGGDTISAIKKAKLDGRFSHISTGGGASLELLEGKILPGIAVLPEK